MSPELETTEMFEATPSTGNGSSPLSVTQAGAALEQVLFEMRRVIVGQDRVLERVLVALLANGHCLLEGVPGLGKTLTVVTLARTLSGTFTRIQFTPDLIPSDLVGTRIYRPSTERFDVELGPVFANFVLADEINRAPAKVQSALLEVMAERQVSLGGTTYPVAVAVPGAGDAEPDRVRGRLPAARGAARPLPHADPGRLPDARSRSTRSWPAPRRPRPSRPGCSARTTSLACSGRPRSVHRRSRASATTPCASCWPPAARRRTGWPRIDGLLAYGASPRASIGLVQAARALALLRGRAHALPQDVYDVAFDVLNHRLVPSFDAVADGVTVDDIVVEVLSTVKAPRRLAATAPAPPHDLAHRGVPGRRGRAGAHGAAPPRRSAAGRSRRPSSRATAARPARPGSTNPATTPAASTGR